MPLLMCSIHVKGLKLHNKNHVVDVGGKNSAQFCDVRCSDFTEKHATIPQRLCSWKNVDTPVDILLSISMCWNTSERAVNNSQRTAFLHNIQSVQQHLFYFFFNYIAFISQWQSSCHLQWCWHPKVSLNLGSVQSHCQISCKDIKQSLF